MNATQKQVDYIIALWNKVNGGTAGYLSQTNLPLTSREKKGEMTKTAASAYIDQLKAELDAKN